MRKTLYILGASVLVALVLASLGCTATLQTSGTLFKKDAKVASERAADGVIMARSILRAGGGADEALRFLTDRGYSKDEAHGIVLIAAADLAAEKKAQAGVITQ